MLSKPELNTWGGVSLGLAVGLATVIAAGVSLAPRLTTSAHPATCIAPVTSSQASTAGLALDSTARHPIKRYWL